jgi:hypothetical protein
MYLDGVANDFQYIATIDPIGSASDNYIKMMDVERFDLSNQYGRTNDKYLNLRLLNSFLKKHRYKKTLIFTASIFIDRFWDEDFKNFIRENDLLFIVGKSGHKYNIKLNNIFVQQTPGNLNDKEFSLKIGAHLSKVIAMQKYLYIDMKNYEFPTFSVTLDNICDLLKQKQDRGVCKLMASGIPFEFVYNIKRETKNLVIIGQSAISGKAVSLPSFQRWKWAFDFNASTLTLNDPTLYLSDCLTCGWFVGGGDDKGHYAKIFAEEILKLSKIMKIEPKNIIFYGASAGGFSSFQIASYIKGSMVVADITQTDLRTYHWQNQISDLTKNIFFSDSVQNINEAYIARFDIISRFIENKNIPNFIFLQNDFDIKHVRSQMLQFIDSLQKLLQNNQFKLPKIANLYIYDSFRNLKGGHLPLNRYATTWIINDVINSLTNNTVLTFADKFSLKEISISDIIDDK